MTKDHPDELCPECRKFDKHINGQHGPNASCDVFVQCDHDVPPKAKDYCEGCEYPELLHMMLPRIEELEKRVKELELNQIALLDWLKIPNKLDAKTDI